MLATNGRHDRRAAGGQVSRQRFDARFLALHRRPSRGEPGDRDHPPARLPIDRSVGLIEGQPSHPGQAQSERAAGTKQQQVTG
ncbi:hypothetical protein [Pseudonocardia sp.]|uniref:hypothetical protein n=1 Tax=Pseudonocardia sp. TaxID=60912 RepID=UPI0031FCEFF3